MSAPFALVPFRVLVLQPPPSDLALLCFRPFDSKNPFLAPVTVNRRLNKGGKRHLMHLELDITGSKIRLVCLPLVGCACWMAGRPAPGLTLCVGRYESGDHVAVFPTNDAALVNKLGQVLGVDLDVVISLNNLDGNTPNPPEDLELMRRHMSEVAGLRHFMSRC